MTQRPCHAVTIRDPRGAQLCGPVLSRAILVGLEPANRLGPLGGAGSPMIVRYFSDAFPTPDSGPTEAPR